MRPRHNWEAVAVLYASIYATAASAISLSNFNPKVSDLPSACDDVYNSHIQGCSKSDFDGRGICSSTCISGLIDVASRVAGACEDADVSPDSIIGVFRDQTGVSQLCPNVVFSTVKATDTATKDHTKTRPQGDTQKTSESEVDVSPPVSSSDSVLVDSSRVAATPTTDPSSRSSRPSRTNGVIVDTGSPDSDTRFSPTREAGSTLGATPSSTSGADGSNGEGGSPFDFQGEAVAGHAVSAVLSSITAILIVGLVFL